MSLDLARSYRDYPSPLTDDVLVVEYHDGKVPQWQEPKPYGTPHPDNVRFPRHKLVAVVREKEDLYRWLYAADRENQQAYNAVITYPYKGNRSYPRYTRTFLEPRATYAPLPQGDPDLADPSAVLVAERQVEMAQGELGSLYVAVTRIYDRIPGAAVPGGYTGDAQATGAGQTDAGYRVERPLGSLAVKRLTWKLVLPKAFAEAPSAAGRQAFTACPIPGFTGLRLVGEAIVSSDEENQTATIERVYAESQPDDTPILEMARKSDLLPPEQFLDWLQTRRSTHIQVHHPTVPTPTGWNGSPPMTRTTEATVAMKTLLEGEKAVAEMQFSYGPLTRQEWDDNLQAHLTIEQIPVETSALSSWLANPSNITAQDTYETAPSGRHWTIVTRIRFPAGSAVSPSLSYRTTKNHSWPRVLRGLTRYDVPTKAGYDVSHFDVEYKDPWSGECSALVQRWWKKTPPATGPGPESIDNQVDFLTPTGLVLDWPVAQLSILECLHPPGTFSGTTGTDHPVYEEYSTFLKEWPGTRMWKGGPSSPVNAYDWPESMVTSYDAIPYRGGYLYTKVTVYRPEHAVMPP